MKRVYRAKKINETVESGVSVWGEVYDYISDAIQHGIILSEDDITQTVKEIYANPGQFFPDIYGDIGEEVEYEDILNAAQSAWDNNNP